MAYCPKCGIEVDDVVRSCPLCQFPIPDVNRGGKDYHISKYPEAKNVYKEHKLGVKNQILFVMIVVFICAIAVLTTVSFVYQFSGRIVEFFIYSCIAAFLYAYFLLGYLRWGFNITGIAFTTIFLTYSINEIVGGSWFYPYALPISMCLFVNGLLFHYLYRHSKRRMRLGYIPTFALGIGTSIGVGIDAIISYNLKSTVKLSWSLILAISCLCFGFVLYFIINHMPAQVKETVNRRLHM